MTPAERDAALERMRTERAAYQARQQPTGTGTPSTGSTGSTGSAMDPAAATIHGELSALGMAVAAYERGTAALYRKDGTPLYSETEHAARLEALQGALDQTIEGAQESLYGVTVTLETTLRHLEHGDPFDSLSLAEKAAATTAQPFIKEDAQGLPAAELEQRCMVALDSGDKAICYLLARYVAQRVEAANRAGHAGQEPELPLRARQDLTTLVERLRETVRGPEGVQKTTAARASLTRAQEAMQRTRVAWDAAHRRPDDTRDALMATGRYSL
jgi:hypothetical protein